MTAQAQNNHGILEAQNFQDEQSLNKENKKILHKMMKYVRTFPLKSIEIEQIRRDLLGMAIEAQKRGTPFQTVLGEKPRKFCDQIIYSIGGIRAPGGRKLLHIAGCFYQITGAFSIIDGLIAFFALLVIAAGKLLNTGTTGITPFELLSSLLCFFIGILYYTAGKRAYQYANDIAKASSALRWGVGMLIFDFIYHFSELIKLFFSPAHSLPSELIYPLWLVGLLFLIFPALYILGAYRNRPHSGTP